MNPDTGKSFTVKLNGQIDTLVTDKLAQNYSGAFDLMVLDGNGKEGFKDAYSLTLKPGFQLQIWMLLLLPLVLIIAFIGYRNLFPLDS